MREQDIPPDHERRAVGFAGLVHSICVTCPNVTVDKVYQEMFPGKLGEEKEKETLAATLPSLHAGPLMAQATELEQDVLEGLDDDELRTHFVAVFGGWNPQVEEQVKAVLDARARARNSAPQEQGDPWSEIDTSTMSEDELRTYYAMLAGGWNLFVEGKVKEAMAMRKSGRMPG